MLADRATILGCCAALLSGHESEVFGLVDGTDDRLRLMMLQLWGGALVDRGSRSASRVMIHGSLVQVRLTTPDEHLLSTSSLFVHLTSAAVGDNVLAYG